MRKTVNDILLVEDNPGDIRLMQEALSENGIDNNLYIVRDGVEAMAFLRREGGFDGVPRPSVILLDLNLPRKGGSEVLAEIKADKDLKRIPVIVLTTSQHEEDVHRCYDLHANCFITKPMDLKRFTKAIESIIQFWLTMVELPL
jgi:CheY-like chemotaxis protein